MGQLPIRRPFGTVGGRGQAVRSGACLLAGLSGLLAAAVARAQEADSAAGLSLYAEARVVSRYIWRGYDQSRGKPALQPYAELTLPFGLGFNAFTTSALDRRTEFDEAQLGATYSREVGGAWEVMGGYLWYVMPGTETEPGGDAADPLAFSSSGEFVVALTRNWDSGHATLTYARGHGSGTGNSVNLWAQRTFALGERWSAEPYVQLDYLDEYGPPSGLSERLSGMEVGVPLYLQLGPVRAVLAAQLTWVPSDYVRDGNVDAAGWSRPLQAWFAVGVVYERD